LQFALFPARWMHRGLTATMKCAMRLIGLPMGDLYPPYVSLDAAETAALADYLKTTVLAKRLIQHAHN
jgi:4-hydroxy-tetrahydrodipicolinate synthase